LAAPVFAQDPVATAQAADQWAKEQQWRANQAAAAAQSARATADAAWTLATAQAAETTATAQWIATATPAAATVQAQATQDALAAEGTRQAIFARATQTAYEQAVQATATAQTFQVTATKAAAIAEQDRLFIEMDRLTLERSRRLSLLYTWGPWVITAVFVALAIWAVRRLVAVFHPAESGVKERLRVETASVESVETVEGEFRLLASTVEEGRWRPVILRPIAPEHSQRRARQQWQH
jgi:hypothetical protein